ncbi:SDR family oxidoreductase [Siphonobacter sp. SORGH_AS_1065]|uniref:SDR family NAD(P)-dependent oxidoreductase n=1 Tax=Siphonobacter sp. SORGH_AS_1065 TaxID=3041795 RepID=UPI002789C7F2|nr:SDR family oxidoreductase [Siphonobacter sp. SORGH_AS_1065]MDQ1089974.1 short-subunit dehydrogenase [Siphonobacter sp. SORGH_AS_1065]
MPYALVTGAAQGIGRSLAEQLAQRKYDLLLVDFQEEKLYQTADYLRNTYARNVHVLTIDLALPGFLRVVTIWQKQITPNLEVLVNNAGFGLNGSFEDLDINEQLDIVNVNVRAVMQITHAFLPTLRKQEKAYLLNVCSTTAYQTVPYLTVYAASKAFVLSFTRGLRHELRGSNVSVTMLSPGSTDTGFVDRARMGESLKQTASKVHMNPDVVAEIAIKALFSGRAEVVPGFLNQVGAWLPRIVPMRLIERVVGNLYKPKTERTLVTVL